MSDCQVLRRVEGSGEWMWPVGGNIWGPGGGRNVLHLLQ